MYPPPVEKLIHLFSRFPTIGKRTATRFALYCLDAPKEEIDDLIDSLKELKKSISKCKICFRSLEKEEGICSICKDERRNKKIICVVEKETDLHSIEKANEYEGIYFILGGNISPLKKENLKNIRAKKLKERIVDNKKFNLPKAEEIIIATNQNPEGEATAIYLEKILNEMKIKSTRLGRGLSTGSELEYADESTLLAALKGRK